MESANRPKGPGSSSESALNARGAADLPDESAAVGGRPPDDSEGDLPPTDVAEGGAPGGPAEDTPIQWGVLLRLGKRYLGAHRAITLVYIVGSLLTMAILPVLVATTFGRLTNHFQSGQSAGAKGAAAPSPAAAPAAPTPPADAASAESQRRVLVSTYAWWVVLLLCTVAITFGHRYVTEYFTVVIEREMRDDVFSSVLRQSPRFFHKHSVGELTMVVNQLTAQAQMALRQLLIDPVLDVAGVIIVGVALYQSLTRLGAGAEKGAEVYGLFAGIAVFVLISPILVIRVGRRLQRQTSTMQRQSLAMATLVGGALAAPEEVQAMQAESRFAAKLRALMTTGMRARLDQTITIERLNMLNSLPGSLVLIALIGAAVVLVGRDSQSAAPSTIVSVALLTPQLMSAVQSLASFSINASMTWPAVEVVAEALRTQSEVEVSPDARDIPSLEPSVETKDVAFSYRPGSLPNVFDDVSFAVRPGTIVGLVSRSGGGKTTIFRLLLRFYDPQGGDVLLGGHSVRAFTLASLRRHVALMTQESSFFHDTVRENFLVAAPDATDDELQRMCEHTGMWAILQSKFGPAPLDAPFVATQLSGGQRKRFALTRMLVRKPSVVLLDEPTVGIDPVDKLPLVDVIKRSCAGRTVFSVDHDLIWQTRLCDRFLVLDGGRIVEDGTGPELLARPGLFRELYDASQNDQLRNARGGAEGSASLGGFSGMPADPRKGAPAMAVGGKG